MGVRMRKIWTAGLLLAALAVVALPAHAFDEVFDKTYHLNPNGSVELENINGSVEITGWDRDAVELFAVKKTANKAADLSRVQIEVEAAPSHLSVETLYPQDKGVEVSVEYRIRVPRHAQLRQVRTVNGAVRVSNMDASGSLRSVNGNVEILDSVGGFSAHTTNGDLRLELHRLNRSEPLDAGTVNGSILVALAPDANAELDVHTLNGDFRSDLPVYIQGSSDSREFHGVLGHGGTSLALRTVNGAIRIVALNPSV
jgi:DUF4097 and DUF4098 domain-containing protein YvlB